MRNAEDLTISTSLTNDSPTSLLPPKIFAQPFRLALKKGDSDDVTWIEVRSLAGLRGVFEKIEKGELTEIDRFSSVEMQLWGHMAEHSGFLRVQGSASSLAAGIQPLGDQAGALADDFASLMGGSDVDALNLLGAMQNTLKSRPLDRTPMGQPEVTHEFVKPDGVNLTAAGENALLDLVYGDLPTASRQDSSETTAFRKESENAVEIFLRDTPPATPEEVEAEALEAIDCQIAADSEATEGPIITGPEAEEMGRAVVEGAALDIPDDPEDDSE